MLKKRWKFLDYLTLLIFLVGFIILFQTYDYLYPDLEMSLAISNLIYAISFFGFGGMLTLVRIITLHKTINQSNH